MNPTNELNEIGSVFSYKGFIPNSDRTGKNVPCWRKQYSVGKTTVVGDMKIPEMVVTVVFDTRPFDEKIIKYSIFDEFRTVYLEQKDLNTLKLDIFTQAKDCGEVKKLLGDKGYEFILE